MRVAVTAAAATPPRHATPATPARPRAGNGNPMPWLPKCPGGPHSGVKGACGVAARAKAAKLRIGRVCQGCLIRWRVEAVGAEAGAGEEPQPCPLAELGEHVPGLDAEEDGQVVAAPVAGGLAGDDGSDPLPAGGRPGRTGDGAV